MNCHKHFHRAASKSRPRTIFVTNITEDEITLAEEQNGELTRSCFICRREEGQEYVWSDNHMPDDVYYTTSIEVGWLVKQVTDEYSFSYPMCPECAVLLGCLENMSLPHDVNIDLEENDECVKLYQ